MEKIKTNAANETQKNNETSTADVLYQRLGDKWYAFSILGDDVYMAAIEEGEIERIRANRAPQKDS